MSSDALTPRESIFLRAVCKGATLTDAAREAGYSENCLSQSGYQAFQRIKEKMPQILDRKGLTEDSVIEKYLLPALEATETEFAKQDGKITDQVDVIAWGPRLQALDMLWKLRGSYAAERHEVTGEDGQPIAHTIRFGDGSAQS